MVVEIIKRPRLELAENGFAVVWEVYSKGEGSYSGESYVKDSKKVFEGFDSKSKMAALDCFIELGKKACLINEENSEEEYDDEED